MTVSILGAVEAGDRSEDRGSRDLAHGDVELDERDSGIVVISLTGEHDLTTAPLLRQHAAGALEGQQTLIIDLSPAAFIDSSIIGVILDTRRQAEEAGTGFAAALSGGQPAVRRVLEVTGLNANLPVHADTEAAIAAAQAQPGDSE